MAEPNKERIKLWTEALRSNKYKQKRNVLGLDKPDGNYPAGNCCLGVACEVAIKNGLNIERYVNEANYISYDGEYEVLPQSVADWYGLKTTSPEFVVEGGQLIREAVELNDSGNYTFADIAGIIEEEFGLIPF